MKIIFLFTGIAAILSIAFLLSANRRAIKLRPVLWGVGLQFLFGVVVLYWTPGRLVLQKIAQAVTDFLGFAAEGSKFLFGNLADPSFTGSFGYQFAIIVLPTIIFFSAVMSILYHYGIMQRVVAGMAWVMAKTMGTSGAESLSCAANVFVGQTEAPLIVRPYISKMTMSEINAVMVGGFGTIAGGVMAGIVGMGVDARYVITASFMAAPASLMIAKILYPETEESITAKEVKVAIDIPTKNGIEAAAKGASDGMQLCLNVAAMLVAFIALVKLLDAGLALLDYTIDYRLLGGLKDIRTNEYIGFVPGSLKTLFSTIFWPLAWLMGVPNQDCGQFSYLIGMKISLNEFFAYSELVQFLNARYDAMAQFATCGFAQVANQGVQAGGLYAIPEFFGFKAEAMVTFALCGFANFSSIAIQIGGISPMAPADQQDSLRAKLARLGVRAMFGGALVSLLTATIAGFLL